MPSRLILNQTVPSSEFSFIFCNFRFFSHDRDLCFCIHFHNLDLPKKPIRIINRPLQNRSLVFENFSKTMWRVDMDLRISLTFFGTMPKISFVRSFSFIASELYTAGIWFLAAQKKTNDVDLSPTSSFVQFSQPAQNSQRSYSVHPSINRFIHYYWLTRKYGAQLES